VLNDGHEVGENGVLDSVLADGVISGGGLDHAFVGEDSLGADECGLGLVLNDLLHLWDGSGESKDLDSGEENSLGFLLAESRSHVFGPEFVQDELQDFSAGEVGSAELSRELNWEPGFSHTGVHAGLVGDGSKGQESNLSVDGSLLIQTDHGLLEHPDEGLSGVTDVGWEGDEVVQDLAMSDILGTNQLVNSHQSRGVSRDEESIVEKSVESGLVVAAALLGKLVVQVQQSPGGEGADEVDNGPVLGHDFVHVQCLRAGAGLLKHLDSVAQEFLHAFHALAFIHLFEDEGNVHLQFVFFFLG
jgi:hypothetical protein